MCRKKFSEYGPMIVKCHSCQSTKKTSFGSRFRVLGLYRFRPFFAYRELIIILKGSLLNLFLLTLFLVKFLSLSFFRNFLTIFLRELRNYVAGQQVLWHWGLQLHFHSILSFFWQQSCLSTFSSIKQNQTHRKQLFKRYFDIEYWSQ